MKPGRFPILPILVALAAPLALATRPASAPAAGRTVLVTVAADEEFRVHGDWAERAAACLREAAEPFLSFGVSFRIAETRAWDSSAPDHDLAALQDELGREIPPDGSDLVIGFAGRVYRREDRRLERLGHSDTPGRCMVVSEGAGSRLPLVLRHELAHAFGVPHVQHVPSLMNENLAGGHADFDPASRAILRNNAGLDFRSEDPLAGCPIEILWTHYRSLADQGNQVADLIAVIGDSYRHRGEPAAAARAYAEARRLDPDLVSVDLGLSMLALEAGNPSEAIQLLETVRRRRPDLRGLDTTLGQAYAAAGRREEAMAACRRALRQDPLDTSALNNLGLLYADEERYDDAEAMFLRALELAPRAEFHRNLGSLYLLQGRPSEARPHIEESLRLAPGQPDAAELRRVADGLKK